MHASKWERRAKICKLPMEIIIMLIVPKETKTGSLGILAGSSEESTLEFNSREGFFPRRFYWQQRKETVLLQALAPEGLFSVQSAPLQSAVKTFPVTIWLRDFCCMSSCPFCAPSRRDFQNCKGTTSVTKGIKCKMGGSHQQTLCLSLLRVYVCHSGFRKLRIFLK